MRRLVPLTLTLVALAVAAGFAQGRSSAPTLTGSCAKSNLNLVADGKLTIGTDNPAYPPWFGGSAGHSWKISDPYSGKGYESAVSYALAKVLGFSKSQVAWTYVPFAKSYAPGPKHFDFDINQISYTKERAKAVSFSASYYNVNQALVVNKGTPIAKVRSIAGLKPYTLGAQLGTTSYQFITSRIKPDATPKVYNSNSLAVAALKTKRIDGLVVDLPTAFYVTAVQVPNSKILGQFKSTTGEHFAMTFQRGNSLVGCVNKALKVMRSKGTLAKIEKTWLSKVVAVPVLK
ncbi:MAG: amino acid ABC transporter substrate-binding protein [Actinobacteria bacterium]|nr:amino acid ABC transporter substrate-binding protein [Actinomycetota bacterium]